MVIKSFHDFMKRDCVALIKKWTQKGLHLVALIANENTLALPVLNAVKEKGASAPKESPAQLDFPAIRRLFDAEASAG